MSPFLLLRDAIDNGVFPGAVALCARGEAVQFHGAEGTLGFAPPFDTPAQCATIYDVASLTKLYVAAAALRCLRARDVALQTPLRQFLPAFDARIRLADLMNHSSGLEVHLQTLAAVPAARWLEVLGRRAAFERAGNARALPLHQLFLAGPRALSNRGRAARNHYRELRFKTGQSARHFRAARFNSGRANRKQWRGRRGSRRSSRRGGTRVSRANRRLRWQRRSVRHCYRCRQIWPVVVSAISFIPPTSPPSMPLRYRKVAARAGWDFRSITRSIWAKTRHQTAGAIWVLPAHSLVVHRATKSVIVLLNNRVHPTRDGPNRMPWHRALAAWSWEQG